MDVQFPLTFGAMISFDKNNRLLLEAKTGHLVYTVNNFSFVLQSGFKNTICILEENQSPVKFSIFKEWDKNSIKKFDLI